MRYLKKQYWLKKNFDNNEIWYIPDCSKKYKIVIKCPNFQQVHQIQYERYLMKQIGGISKPSMQLRTGNWTFQTILSSISRVSLKLLVLFSVNKIYSNLWTKLSTFKSISIFYVAKYFSVKLCHRQNAHVKFVYIFEI